ncbi:MAG: DUF4097 domain-containing protein, partial [Oscillochloris sp.]|nr:DUF4097 domain-containing protein [Oscillochloris sp.]
MSEQRFPVGAAPSLRITNGGGDISVEVWDEEAILVESGRHDYTQYQEGDTLVIEGCSGDLVVHAPARTLVTIHQQAGDVRVEGVRQLIIERADGDVHLEDLAEGAQIGQLNGDLRVERTPRVVGPGPIQGDADFSAVEHIELGRVSGDLSANDALVLVVASIGGDLDADGLAERCQVGSVGGDLHLEPRGPVEVLVESVGGDLHIKGNLANLQCSNVAGDLTIEGQLDRATFSNVGGDLEIDQVHELRVGNVGGDLKAHGLALLELGAAGGDCKLIRLVGSLNIGTVGGDLTLQASFVGGTSSRVNVAGDINLQLVSQPNLTLTAIVGGQLRGAGASASGQRTRVNLCYGTGEASLDLRAGGDLRISGVGDPQSSSASASSSSASTGTYGFDVDMSGFGREMSELGRELGRMGRDLANEITAAFANEGVARGGAWAEEAARKLEEKARRLQEQAEERTRRAEARARTAEEKARLRVKINEREWQIAPERLERIKEQARRAAAEGVSGALEAVERALGRMR